ncbi:nucleoside-diphosphate-sugar epimerase [Burkholderia cenocepacia]|nr:nucleoside-diphosphate-sugar epimerase [Burkholderia cenocepacia]
MTTDAGGTQRLALVLGASGGIGGEVARQLRDAGWQVRALKRGLDAEIAERDGIAWVRGDALDRDAVVRAARGCSVIVHAVNPPGYRNWATQVLPMIDNTIAAARAAQATVVLPGTVYNFGADAFPVLREDAPQHPATRKGAIRVELERRLQDASVHGVRGDRRARRRFFRAAARQQLVFAGVGQAGAARRGHQRAGPRRRPSMVVCAGRGARDGRADRAARDAGAVRALSSGRALG